MAAHDAARSAAASDRQLYRRTEAEVAADTIVALLDDGLLPRRAPVIRRAARAVGITTEMVRDAHTQFERRGFRRPSGVRCEEPVIAEAERHIERTAHGQIARRPIPNRDGSTRVQSVHRPSQPTPDTKRCPMCGETKAVTEFGIKVHRTGQRKAYCRSCMITYQKRRYVKAKALGLWSAVQHRLEHGEPFVGDECCDCGQSFEVGQTVEVGDIALRHVTCA